MQLRETATLSTVMIHPRLYIGVDVGKENHTLAYVSQGILQKYKRFELCPLQKMENGRKGFEDFLAGIDRCAGRANTFVLLERTGHYGNALEQFLLDSGITVYRMQARKRYASNKTDELDARALALLLYNQVELRVHLMDEKERVQKLIPALPVARKLRGLVRHRYELTQELARRANKLHAICDEVFPEFCQIFKDPNGPTALAMRLKFPAPSDIAAASIDDLLAVRLHHHPSTMNLVKLQELARASIGVKDDEHLYGLLIEQRQLISEVQTMQKHVDELDAAIEEEIKQSRPGRILDSIPGISPTQAAALLAGIGTIANFESDAHLRSYLGWSPRRTQTGTSYDNVVLNRAGNTLLKQTMYMVVLSAIKSDSTWKALYDRLVERKCNKDIRTGRYKGKMKVIGRIAGQLIRVIFTLLMQDYQLKQSWTGKPEDLPEPELYSPEKHRVKH